MAAYYLFIDTKDTAKDPDLVLVEEIKGLNNAPGFALGIDKGTAYIVMALD